ncbi:MAG: hypothetical protein IOC90_13865 [Methylocystis sp.]|nr:hypothetical protein [Methylocystis sp.]MCA3583399.1 hypothetical protein [Methylocystis sp.]MCA3589100.1 hypothetical protein [Methylocystis sp.]MCA3591918.1 hypothetical protein [Methylocystis sp.]
MRVSDRAPTNALNSAGSAQRAGAASTRFSLAGAGSTDRASQAQSAAPASLLNGLLAVQAAGDSLERRKRAIKRGGNLLDTLDQLKIALLSGRVSAEQLELLKAQARQRGDSVDDPGLADILAHIELRAEVEIAKLSRR